MANFHRAATVGVLLACTGLTQPAGAEPIDLTGAWATDIEQCGKVFERKGSKVTFSDLSDLYGGGFIVEANHISGKSARCTIASRKQDGDMVHLLASCATDIMYSRVQFSLKVVDENTVRRLFPGMPDIQMPYQRCPAAKADQ